jgi:integrin beta 1
MKDNAPDYVKITYYSKCLGKERMQTNTCKGLKVGDVVEFETEIVVNSCPADPKDREKTLKIYPVGVGEVLTVDLEMLCSCSCESSGLTFERNSRHCNNKGTLSCGICMCPDGFFGRNCECSQTNIGDAVIDALKCRPNNETDVECSGKGSCVCGECHCYLRENGEESYSGQFCECDNFSCDRSNGEICSGHEHGTCECGKCKCLDGWKGTACECSSSTDTCMAPNGEICSGQGECKCGRCECKVKDNVRYSGKYCEKCPSCPGRCSEFKSCVECQMYKKGVLKNSDDCAKNCTLFVPISVETVDCE